jgi:hypothetical protein
MPVAMMPPLKKKQMEQQQTINYAKNVRAAIMQNMYDCAVVCTDTEDGSNINIVHKKQYEVLKKLLYDIDFIIAKIEMDINNYLQPMV